MSITLSEHINYKKIITLTFSSVIMPIFSSLYCVVDGFFISNYVGKTAFSAFNLIMPVLIVLGAIGFMFGMGGGALIAKTICAFVFLKTNKKKHKY